jgi:hypothetical protein
MQAGQPAFRSDAMTRPIIAKGVQFPGSQTG